MRQPRRAYDHRLRQHLSHAGPIAASARHFRIPRSTLASWKSRGPRPVVTLEPFNQDRAQLVATITQLERRTQILGAIVRLLLALVRVSGFRLAGERLPEGTAKADVLRAISGAQSALPLAQILRVLHLPPSRFHAWRRAAVVCGLDDRSPCPRTLSSKLAAAEVAIIKDMVLDSQLRHMPLGTLSVYAQRVGRVFASVSTWSKLVRARGWRRPRARVHPEKPTLGIRATRPNEYWHIDVTILKLLDGTRAYLHAVIDNYSRKILAWRLLERLEPATTCAILVAASQHLPPSDLPPTVVADSGVENVNNSVDALLNSTKLRRVLAQVEVTWSNSIIEAWWRSLKHQWLYLHSLDSVAGVQKLVAFFVEEHNTKMPHSAFHGHTPDEMYFGTAANLPDQLAAARRDARQRRLAVNRALSCPRCSPPILPLIAQRNPP